MAQCCNDCFKICEPLNDCPAAFYIYAPIDYMEEDIILNITKPGVNVRIQQLLTIDVEGFIEVDLAAMPEGFLNPWGGEYQISFSNPGTQKPIIFTASDGVQYSSICLSFANTITDLIDNFIVINIFTDNLPS